VAVSRPARRPSLVVLRALGLGDLLASVPALRALADAYPSHRRVLAAPAALAPIALATGAVHGVADTAPLAPLDGSLGRPDVAVNLHGRGPESHRLVLALRPARTIAFASEAAGVPGPRWRQDEHEVPRWCRLLEEEGIPADPSRLGLELAPGPLPAGAEPLATVVHPGAASPARRWPAESFARVARAERRAGRRVVVTGTAGEAALAQRVARAAGLEPSAVLAGRTRLLELARVVAAAGRVVSGDTGVAHLATAFGVPSVVLFGPTPPSEWGPPPDRPHHVALYRGGRGDPHGGAPDPGLLAITVEDVLEVTSSGSLTVRSGNPRDMSMSDKISGRFKKAVGDLTDDASMRQQGRKEERKGEAKEEMARAEERADAKADEVANLERRT
jgi:ADP-heptose:LPS heptosyltransferase/uncharacterized protein YjbJ (UPF0337 family)